MLRQKDVIGEWVPRSEPGPSDIWNSDGEKWLRGLRWQEIDGNLIGTPEVMLEKHAMRTSMVGEYDMLANFSFGGMPFEEVYKQMKLFADKVMPVMKG